MHLVAYVIIIGCMNTPMVLKGLIKRLRNAFLWILWNFENHLFWNHFFWIVPLDTAIFSFHKQNTLFFYKRLGSDLCPQSCLYFQSFRDSRLLNGCLVVSPSNLFREEYNNFQDSKSIFMISDFKIFPIMLLRQLNCGVLSV